MRKNLYILAVIALAVFSCEKNEEKEAPVETTLEISGLTSVQNVEAGAGEMEFKVKSNAAWNIEAEEVEWIGLDKTSGNGAEDIVKAVWSANENEDSRRFSFTVKAGDKEEGFTIIQAGAEAQEIVPELTVTGIEKKTEVDCQERELKFTVLSNCIWSIDVKNLTYFSTPLELTVKFFSFTYSSLMPASSAVSLRFCSGVE